MSSSLLPSWRCAMRGGRTQSAGHRLPHEYTWRQTNPSSTADGARALRSEICTFGQDSHEACGQARGRVFTTEKTEFTETRWRYAKETSGEWRSFGMPCVTHIRHIAPRPLDTKLDQKPF